MFNSSEIELVGYTSPNFKYFEEDLAKDLGKMFLSKTFTDIQFECEGKIIDAHRNVLVSRSNYFKGLLCENLKSNRLAKPVHVENCSYEAFRVIIYFLYTDQIEPETKPEALCEAIRVSDWYNIDELKSVAFNYFSENLTADNAIVYLKASQEKEPILENVSNLSLHFILRSFSSIVTRQDFKELTQPLLLMITQYIAKNKNN